MFAKRRASSVAAVVAVAVLRGAAGRARPRADGDGAGDSARLNATDTDAERVTIADVAALPPVHPPRYVR